MHTEIDSQRKQDQNYVSILNLINIQSVNLITKPIGYSTTSVKYHDSSSGVINMIFFVEAVSNDSKHSRFVLRIANPVNIWKHVKQNNEVHALHAIYEWNDKEGNEKIPVPKILSYSSDASSSPIGLEYTLTDFINGVNHENDFSKLSIEKKMKTWEDWKKYAQLIPQIPASSVFKTNDTQLLKEYSSKCCGIHSSDGKPSSLIWDGIPVGPADSYAQMFFLKICTALDSIKKSTILPTQLKELQLFNNLVMKIEKVISKLQQNGYELLHALLPEPENGFCFSHDDLHDGNILFDPETGAITAVLDWDRCQWGPFSEFARDSGECMISTLFKGTDFESTAQLQLDKLFPSDLGMKKRKFWGLQLERPMWITFFLVSWQPPLQKDELTGEYEIRDDSVLSDWHIKLATAICMAMDYLLSDSLNTDQVPERDFLEELEDDKEENENDS